jgi:hypothetical protein
LDATSIRDHDQLVALVRRRQNELNLSCLAIDEVAGLADGHFSKLTCGIKKFGPVSIFLVLEALGLRIRVEEDPEAIAALAGRWQPRDDAARPQRCSRHHLQANGAAASGGAVAPPAPAPIQYPPIVYPAAPRPGRF